MHHSNFLRATGHQCCLSALCWEYGTGGLQRTHPQAKNIPTSLYTPVDYSIITLIRSKGNYCFASGVPFVNTQSQPRHHYSWPCLMTAAAGPLRSHHPARRVLIPQPPTPNTSSSSCRRKASVGKSWSSSDRTSVTVRRWRLCPSLLAPERGHLPQIHSACTEHLIPQVRPAV